MSDFTTIETQEQFDEAIGERIRRERETVEKKYTGYLSPDDFESKKTEYETQIQTLNETLNAEKEKITGFQNEIAERDNKIKGYESNSVKMRIANDTGLSINAVKFLKGDNEEEIKKSAEELKSIMGKATVPPLASTETNPGNSKDKALRQTLRKLRGE